MRAIVEEGSRSREPFAARLHFLPRNLRRPHTAIVGALRPYFESAPGWVLLTTRGRKTGLPREVLLPCVRAGDEIIVISTYGWRSDWIRNLRKNPTVQVTCAGRRRRARAEVIQAAARKRAIISKHPFFPLAPFKVVHAVALTALRPLLVSFLRQWVTPRPLVLIRLAKQ